MQSPVASEPPVADERPLLLRELPVIDFAKVLSSTKQEDVEARYLLASQYLESGEPRRALALLAEVATKRDCSSCTAMIGRSRWDDAWRAYWPSPLYHVILESAAAVADPSGPPIRCPDGTQSRAERKSDTARRTWCETPRGKRHGRYLEVGEGRNVDGAFVYGAKHGLWIVEREELKERVIYANGKRDGAAVSLNNRTGRIVRRVSYRRGRRHGLYKEWHDLSNLPYGLKVDGRYRGGKKNGSWSHFDAHGTERVRQSYRGGVRHGRFSYWDDGGRLIRSLEMKRGAGDWVAFDVASRKIEEGRIVGRHKIGRWMESEGGQGGWREGRYRGGKRQGMWTFFGSTETRKVAEGRYRGGKRVGGWSYWHDSGVLASAGTFVRDERHGEWVVFDQSGHVAQTLEFRRGTLLRVNGVRATRAMRRRLREADVGRGPTIIEIASD